MLPSVEVPEPSDVQLSASEKDSGCVLNTTCWPAPAVTVNISGHLSDTSDDELAGSAQSATAVGRTGSVRAANKAVHAAARSAFGAT